MIGKLFLERCLLGQWRPIPTILEKRQLGQLGTTFFQGAPPNRAAAGSAGVPPAGRRERGKQAKRPMFSVISHPSGMAGSRTSGSHALLLQKVTRHFRGCGILPRSCGWRAGGEKKTNRTKGDKVAGREARGRREGGQFSEKATWTTLLWEERGRDGGGISAAKDTKGTKSEGRRAGGGWEEGIYKNVSNAVART